MPLESATFINQLVPADPNHTDGINQADSHLRLIKSVLQTTFPNLTGAVTAAQGDLNGTTGLVNVAAGSLTVPKPTGSTTTGGSAVLAGAGAFGAVGISNVSGVLGFIAGGNEVAAVGPGGDFVVTGSLTAANINLSGGASLIPSGVIVMWHGSIATIPSGWLLCNGTSGTPDLRDRFIIGAGLTFGPASTGGQNTVTAGTSSDGAHTHTGATGAAGSVTPTGSMDVQGAHAHTGATAGTSLTVAELPVHSHEQQIGQGSGGGGSATNISGPASSITDAGFATQNTGSGNPHAHNIASDGAHAHNIFMNATPSHTHSISSDGAHTHITTVTTTPPFFALAYIMKA